MAWDQDANLRTRVLVVVGAAPRSAPPVEDENTGAQSHRYVRTATDHYSLAFVYECIAASRHAPVDLRMYGWIGGIDRQSDIRTMRF